MSDKLPLPLWASGFQLARHTINAPNWSQLIEHFTTPSDGCFSETKGNEKDVKVKLRVKERKFETSISIKCYCDCRSGVNHFPFNSLHIQSTSSNWFVCLQAVKKKTVLSFISRLSTPTHKLFFYLFTTNINEERWEMKWKREPKINVLNWL